MPESINFTQQRIEKLPIPSIERKDYYDIEISKLICRVSASGNKSFCVLKRMPTGKLRRVTLGKWPEISVSEARKMAQATLTDMAKGINPSEKKRKEKIKKITLSELMSDYIEQKGLKLKASTAADYQKKLKEGFSDWLDKPVTAISREMVAMRHKKLPGNSTSKDNKMRILRILMRYAQTIKIIEESPTDVLKKAELGLWSKPVRKNRIIPADRLKVWYEAVLQLNNQKVKTYIFLLLYTGLRANEALHLQWENIDVKNDSITVMNTKNGTNFSTYMSKILKSYLLNLKEMTGYSIYVFPGITADGVMAIPRWPFDQVTLKTGIKFSSHDLRRTFATIAEASLLPETIIKRLLNHATDNTVTGGYIRTEANTLKQAIDRIALSIDGLVYDLG
jgi:integrase